MDVNGTRFHLIKGQTDWLACREAEPDLDLDLGVNLGLGDEDGVVGVSLGDSPDSRLYWDDRSCSLTLRPLLSLFHPGRSTAPLGPEDRRGAAADRFGNWYWIGEDRQTLYWSSPGVRPRLFWAQTAPVCDQQGGEFEPVITEQPQPIMLAGLTVTCHHYLVVGNVTQHGLFIFDLHAGGEPTLLLFPTAVPFEPFDIAPAPDGGLWILDRANRAYWGLDRHFRIVTEPALMRILDADETFPFHPVGSAGVATIHPGRRFPTGFPLAAQDPVSIEALPDGSVLILDNPPSSPGLPPGSSISLLYRFLLGDQQGAAVSLEADVDVETSDGKVERHLTVVGHDIAFVERDRTLYVADNNGKQVIAFTLDYSGPELQLKAQVDYLPLHAYGGRGLVAAEYSEPDASVFYDVGGRARPKDANVHWVALRAIEQPRYETSAALTLGSTSAAVAGTVPSFDGKERDCVWHRLLIDACIPSETSVEVWTRANNSLEMLDDVPFTPEPDLYLRGAGAEIPFYKSFPARDALPKGTGTWELLFQGAYGRYIQVRLVLQGNGRATPQLRAVRLYYPRFSYPKHYLPAVYMDDRQSASFVERLLANPEGFYTEIEGKINAVSVMFDARSAPPETLDWLAGWWGLLMDPIWERIQQYRQDRDKQQAQYARTTYQTCQGWQVAPDRRRLFIRFARKLYERRGTLEGIQFALHLLLDPCLETTLQAFKAAALKPNLWLRTQLDWLNLPYPTAVMSDQQLEDLLYDFVLAPRRPSKVRIVERFLTRGGGKKAVAAGDASAAASTEAGSSATDTTSVAASAHRFSVLVPDELSPEEAAMVKRIVMLEKPAHTLFDVRQYFDYFRVGEARVGLDTALGQESRFVNMVLGRNYLAEGYLAPTPPMDAPDRVIADRDRLGMMPPL